jgi:hypothetical protein
MNASAPKGYLSSADVAALFSRLAGREIKVETVWAYLKQSRPMVGKRPGRYADNPMPAPIAGLRSLLWPEAARGDLEAWWKGRATRAHRTGRQAPGPRTPKG